MGPDLPPIILALVATGAGLVVMLLVVRRQGRTRAERLAPAFELGTSHRVGPLGTVIEGLYRGYACRYTVQHASQYNPGGASLRLASTGPSRWSAEITGAGNRLLTRLGILGDLEIGAPELDERLRFAAADEGSLRSLLGAEVPRRALRTLVDTENFSAVRVREDRVEAKWTPRDRRLDEDPMVVRERLEAVTGLLEACGYPPRMA